MQLTSTMYDVALDGHVTATFESRSDAAEFQAQHPRSQIRTRSESKTVPAAFAVFVNGQQVGDTYNDAGTAAKVAKQCGGQLKMVPAAG